MFAMRIFAALHTGQIPVGGITQSMRRWHPQLQLSMPAMWFTAGLSYSVAVWAKHRAVAISTSRLAFFFIGSCKRGFSHALARDSYHLGAREHQLGLARDQADDS